MQCNNKSKPLRIGILGFGHLGQFIYKYFENEHNKSTYDFDLIFIWNRSKDIFFKYNQELKQELIVSTIEEGLQRLPDLIIEVAHPDVIETYAEKILNVCDLFIGSPTALANASLETALRKKTMESGHVIYIGTGAFWGAEDITKMNERNTLCSLSIAMKKHPDSYKLNEPLHSKLIDQRTKLGDQQGEMIIYSGPVRELCRLAPNNVNTMAIGAIIASHLGFDGVQGRLVADTALDDRHIVEIELTGPEITIGETKQLGFHLKTIRTNPAQLGAVTGTATLLSFVSSIKRAKGRTTGIHIV
jgi:predicted dinucleotide-utilizing enzyme